MVCDRGGEGGGGSLDLMEAGRWGVQVGWGGSGLWGGARRVGGAWRVCGRGRGGER